MDVYVNTYACTCIHVCICSEAPSQDVDVYVNTYACTCIHVCICTEALSQDVDVYVSRHILSTYTSVLSTDSITIYVLTYVYVEAHPQYKYMCIKYICICIEDVPQCICIEYIYIEANTCVLNTYVYVFEDPQIHVFDILKYIYICI